MDLLDWIAILFRRWWLTVPLLLLSLIGVGVAAFATPWTYEAKATAVLLSSPTQAKQAGGNPWLVFDGSLTVTAEVVGRELMADETVSELRGRGLIAEYQLGVAADSGGPVLAVDVTGTSPGTTKATLDAVLAAIPRTLDTLQANEGVKDKARIKVKVITTSPEATLVPTKKVRTLVMLLFVGIVLTVAVPLFVEVLLERRANRGGLLMPSRDPSRGTYLAMPGPAEPEPAGANGARIGTSERTPVATSRPRGDRPRDGRPRERDGRAQDARARDERVRDERARDDEEGEAVETAPWEAYLGSSKPGSSTVPEPDA